MQILYAKYRIVTPMFIGDANQKVGNGIRPPSIKGLLRFWWRALNWGRCWEANKNNEAQALQQLHQEEQCLFGAAMDSQKNTGGQGCFLLSVEQNKGKDIINDWPPNKTDHGASYIAYGLLKTQQEPHREALLEMQTFSVKLLFKPNTCTQYKQQLKTVLEVWALLGGLGGRSRRAMGAITLYALDNKPCLFKPQEYKAALEKLFKSFQHIPPAPFTALSQDSRYRIVNTGRNARTLLKKIGQSYKEFRKQKGISAQQKIAFGLPLKQCDEENRRSSPLFFHIQQLEQGQFASSLCFLPSQTFHPSKHYPMMSLQVVEDYLFKGAY